VSSNLSRLQSPSAVQSTLAEFSTLGRTAFLARYGFGKRIRIRSIEQDLTGASALLATATADSQTCRLAVQLKPLRHCLVALSAEPERVEADSRRLTEALRMTQLAIKRDAGYAVVLTYSID
jgi:hypothetical protein